MRKLSDLRAQTDVGLVERAKQGDQVALNQLIQNHKDLLSVKSSVYRKAPIPMAAIEGEAMNLLVIAVQKYDPASGANFRTYLEHMLRGLNRYVNSNKNIARIPENKFLRMGHYMNVKSLLMAQYNRPPTIEELSDELGWSKPDVVAMEQALKQRDLSTMDYEEQGHSELQAARMKETSEFVYAALSPDERKVYDYTLGAHGKPQVISVVEVSKKTGLTPDQVYKIRRSVTQKITEHL